MTIRADPERLKAFLADPMRPAGTLRYHELQGFLFAVTSAPELIRPPEWLPAIFNGAPAIYASIDEAQAMLGAIMALYNDINDGVFARDPALPDDCAFRRGTLANFDDDAPVSQWARGFGAGHQWLEASWEHCVPEDLEEEFGAVLMTLTFFGSRRLAEAYLDETGKTDLQAFARTVRRLFPDALASYAILGRSIAEGRDHHAQPPPPARSRPGRNAPCPCGSGRKYKKCCGAG